MNKQEAIKKLESIKVIGNDAIAACYNESINAGITLMKKIDEPQKPVVPKFVAEWFEEKEGGLENAIFYECVRVTDTYSKDYSEFQRWFVNCENNPIETLIRMKNGYEVEKEPLYYIKLPSTYNTFLVESDDGDLIVWQNTDKGTPFTEKRIKEIDERYWPFAVPVEEVTK
ncbi:TPA: DUF1642 domain-containing protein [Enterococcus faecium]|uniref:DUF1642 domain-containing protein n=1 Tax=Enterococcus lactis TaxID=357441 RepID=UPI0036D4F86E